MADVYLIASAENVLTENGKYTQVADVAVLPCTFATIQRPGTRAQLNIRWWLMKRNSSPTIFHRKKQASAGDMAYSTPSAFDEWKPNNAGEPGPRRGPVAGIALATFFRSSSCVMNGWTKYHMS